MKDGAAVANITSDFSLGPTHDVRFGSFASLRLCSYSFRSAANSGPATVKLGGRLRAMSGSVRHHTRRSTSARLDFPASLPNAKRLDNQALEPAQGNPFAIDLQATQHAFKAIDQKGCGLLRLRFWVDLPFLRPGRSGGSPFAASRSNRSSSPRNCLKRFHLMAAERRERHPSAAC
jgi:hypothetical protein